MILQKNVTDLTAIYEANTVAIFPLSEKRLLTTLNNLKKWAMQARMSSSISIHHTESLMQLWQSEPNKRVKEEMKGGKTARCCSLLLPEMQWLFEFTTDCFKGETLIYTI